MTYWTLLTSITDTSWNYALSHRSPACYGKCRSLSDDGSGFLGKTDDVASATSSLRIWAHRVAVWELMNTESKLFHELVGWQSARLSHWHAPGATQHSSRGSISGVWYLCWYDGCIKTLYRLRGWQWESFNKKRFSKLCFNYFYNSYCFNERRRRVNNIPSLHSGCPGFKSRLGESLSWLGFFVTFFSTSK